MSKSMEVCRLCSSSEVVPFHKDKHRSYFECLYCKLVMVPSGYFLSSAAERQEYDLHENDIYDDAYRNFLNRIFLPLSTTLPLASKGLDFGCGPGPALAEMFKESGFQMSLYDKFYYPDAAVLTSQYDFITMTEVAEHLSEPFNIFTRLWNILKPGGMLGVMTKLVEDKKAFAGWHYKNDPTHITFYHKETLEILKTLLGASRLELLGKDTFIFTK